MHQLEVIQLSKNPAIDSWMPMRGDRDKNEGKGKYRGKNQGERALLGWLNFFLD
jgi:hypothetical protein